jgi:diacylglycerol diphosphate phosphatase/phosphatidate phosphatase
MRYSVLIGTFYIIDKVEPFHQPFSLQNYTLHYPFAEHERIPVHWLVVICVGAPAVIIGIYTMVIDGLFSHKTAMPTSRGIKRLTGRYRFKDRLWELNCGILGLGLSVGAAFTITGMEQTLSNWERHTDSERRRPEERNWKATA